MKRLFIAGIVLFSGVAFASESLHNFSSSDNPHAKSGCASKGDKVVKFHGENWRHENSEKKVDQKIQEQKVKPSDFI